MSDLLPAHRSLTFMTPLSEARATSLVGFAAEGLSGTVVDLGCGWAELLLRVLDAAPDARGIGVDLDEAAIRHGTALATDRGLSGRLSLVCGDARTATPSDADAVVCIGSSQIWGPPVEANQPLDYASALAALRALVPRGAHVVYGEGIWSRPPTPDAAAPLSGRLDEFTSLAGLLDLVDQHGFAPVEVHEANQDEWDEFESGYAAASAHWLAEHGHDHPDAGDIKARAARQRAAYFGGYRGVLGMAYLCLVAV